MKFAVASVSPQSTATRSSFQSTLNMLLNSISPSDSARMTDTDAWEPALPPEPVIIGMNDERMITLASIPSNAEMIVLVKVAESMSTSSHGTRFL